MPTWVDDIKYFFTQYDVIQMKKLAGGSLDLSNFQSVRENADLILKSVLSSGKNDGLSKLGIELMPINGVSWDEVKIEKFQKWKIEGFEYGGRQPDPVTYSPFLDKFINLSSQLTGFDDLDHFHAQKLLDRLSKKNEFAERITSVLELENTLSAEELMASENRDLGQVIILLWYTGAFYGDAGYPIDAGEPENHQYKEGLVWRAGECHPMGFSTEGGYHIDGEYNKPGSVYWENKPTSDGRNTGLGME